MRPVRFVALSEDGQALVLADEVGRLLTLPIDDRISGAVRHDRSVPPGQFAGATDPNGSPAALSPRDIQSRIRSGESAEEVARIAGVPVDRVLRYAGPVLQERAMLAQHARRTRLRSSERGATLAEIVDVRLSQHGVDADGVSWDAYRRDDGTWRITASWASGKATAQAIWALDKARQVVTPDDDMAQFLSAERPAPLLGQEPVPEQQPPARSGHALTRPDSGRDRGESRPSRGGSRSARGESRPSRGTGGHGLPQMPPHREPVRRLADTARNTLDRPLREPTRPAAEPLFDTGAPEDAGQPAAAAALPEAPADTPTAEPLHQPKSEPLHRPAAEPLRAPNAEPLRPEPRRAEPLRPTGDSRRPAEPYRVGEPAASGFAEPRHSVAEARERQGLGFVEEDPDSRELPAVPSLAVLRPRRTEQGATSDRSRLPSWDDVLFGSGGQQSGR
jgi:DUF3071 family protein